MPGTDYPHPVSSYVSHHRSNYVRTSRWACKKKKKEVLLGVCVGVGGWVYTCVGVFICFHKKIKAKDKADRLQADGQKRESS